MFCKLDALSGRIKDRSSPPVLSNREREYLRSFPDRARPESRKQVQDRLGLREGLRRETLICFLLFDVPVDRFRRKRASSKPRLRQFRRAPRPGQAGTFSVKVEPGLFRCGLQVKPAPDLADSLGACPSIPKAAVESTSSCSYARTTPQSITRKMITQTRS